MSNIVTGSPSALVVRQRELDGVVFSDDVLFLDIESHSITERFDMTPDQYFRLGQMAWGEHAIWTTTSRQEVLDAVRSARLCVVQNGHMFDWSVLFGIDSIEPVTMARERRLFDTMDHATLTIPAPFEPYVNHEGKTALSDGPEHYRRWYGLANLAHQLGTEGKLFDLSKLADKFSYRYEPTISTKTGRRLKNDTKVKIEGLCCGYGAIPVDDPEFVAYAVQDIVALRNVARALLARYGFTDYAQFEQMKNAIAAQVMRNGFRLDVPLARAKEKIQLEEAAWILNGLKDDYGFPIEGKKPLTSKPGKEALAKALVATGVKLSDLVVTKKTKNGGGGNLSFGGDSVREAAEKAGTPEALALAEAVGTLAGQRSLPQLSLASVWADGKVHPDIMPLQRSARFSTTNPGLTIWSKDHKDLYLPDTDDDLLVDFDFSNADARAVAAMSGDRAFAARFAPGADGHMINAHLLWGADVVGYDKHDPITAEYRFRAKAPGHGIGYGMGPDKMAETTGLSLEECRTFCRNYKRAYPGVVAWQKRTVDFARKYGYVESDWGRRMVVEQGRAHTQATGLLGQNATHELLLEGCIRLPDRLLRRVKLTVHDAVVFSLAKATIKADCEIIVRCFTQTWHPKGGQEIEFPLSYGEPAENWALASHD